MIEAWFVCSSSPWFVRGAYWVRGVEAGVFTFGQALGYVSSACSFRIVLSF